jgi:phage head maturation protease
VKGHIYKNIGFVKNELAPLIEAGNLSYLSTMGFANKISERDNGYFVEDFELLAISLVNIPADMDAYVKITSNGEVLQRNEYNGPKPKKKETLTNKILLI